MKIAAKLTGTTALQEVHADRDVVLTVNCNVVGWMSVSAFVRIASTDAALVLAADLYSVRSRPCPKSRCVHHPRHMRARSCWGTCSTNRIQAGSVAMLAT